MNTCHVSKKMPAAHPVLCEDLYVFSSFSTPDFIHMAITLQKLLPESLEPSGGLVSSRLPNGEAGDVVQ